MTFVTMTEALEPPGLARITRCPECLGEPGHDCRECHGTGRIVYRACPRCGDIGWDFLNGRDEADGMACRMGCGWRWSSDDPGWVIQHLPG